MNKVSQVLRIITPMRILLMIILIAMLPQASAGYTNESIEMVTFPIGEVSYKAFVYSPDMCNALDCYRSYEMML